MMCNLTQDQIIQQKTEDRKEQVTIRRYSILLVVLSGLMGLGGGLGSQAIDSYKDAESKYEVFVYNAPIDSNLNAAIVRLEKQTGKTWYARIDKEDSNNNLIWVQIK